MSQRPDESLGFVPLFQRIGKECGAGRHALNQNATRRIWLSDDRRPTVCNALQVEAAGSVADRDFGEFDTAADWGRRGMTLAIVASDPKLAACVSAPTKCVAPFFYRAR